MVIFHAILTIFLNSLSKDFIRSRGTASNQWSCSKHQLKKPQPCPKTTTSSFLEVLYQGTIWTIHFEPFYFGKDQIDDNTVLLPVCAGTAKRILHELISTDVRTEDNQCRNHGMQWWFYHPTVVTVIQDDIYLQAGVKGERWRVKRRGFIFNLQTILY